MAPRKLSDSDKSEIVDLYRQPGQTTSTLAEQYGVSNSTVSRILKMSLPPDEYSELISQKRMSGSDAGARRTSKKTATKKTATKKAVVDDSPAVPEFEPATNQPLADGSLAAESEQQTDSPKLKPAKKEAEESSTPRRRRRRSRAKSQEDADEQLPLLTAETEKTATPSASEEETAEEKSAKPAKTSSRPKPVLSAQKAEDITEEEDEEDDLLGLDEALGDDFGDDEDDLIEDDDDDDEADDLPAPRLSAEAALSIMPLDEAVMPKPCYLVVDMRAELITRPLIEFSDLGKIPSSEERERTLPVFDNHRVARRFSRNKQRVIKVPDGSLITRTSPYLTAKGITRLLVDGQVFDLVGAR